MIHHLLSHSDTADWLKVNQFFLEQLAYIARKLDAIQEGERTALDNSMILFCSSMLTGSHDATQLPVVLLGRGGGKIQSGRVLDYLRQAQPQDVQPVPVDDGQGRRAPRSSSATRTSGWRKCKASGAVSARRQQKKTGGPTPRRLPVLNTWRFWRFLPMVPRFLDLANVVRGRRHLAVRAGQGLRNRADLFRRLDCQVRQWSDVAADGDDEAVHDITHPVGFLKNRVFHAFSSSFNSARSSSLSSVMATRLPKVAQPVVAMFSFLDSIHSRARSCP